jgi:hypothetical protein
MGAGNVLNEVDNYFICNAMPMLEETLLNQYCGFAKTILFILLLLAVRVPEVHAEGEGYAVFEENHKKGLVDEKGDVLIPAWYEDLGWSNGDAKIIDDVIGFKLNGLWGILNTKNQKVTKPQYLSLDPFNNNWIVASKKLPYNSTVVHGVINTKGRAMMAFQYTGIVMHQDQLIMTFKDDDNYVSGTCDAKGKPVIPLRFERVNPITDHLYEVRSRGKWAIFDLTGHNLTGFVIDSVNTLTKQYLITHQKGKQGVMRADGLRYLPPKYKNITIADGKLQGEQFRRWTLLTCANEQLRSLHYDKIAPQGVDVYSVAVGGAQALIHVSDSLLSPFLPFQMKAQIGKWILVKKGAKSGLLQLDGQLFLKPDYDSIRYEQGFLLVKTRLNDKRGWSMLNLKGQQITDQAYEELNWLGDAYFEARRGNYWGVVDRRGKEIIFCKYDSIVRYSDGRLQVRFMGEDGILNIDGSWEILPQKKDIEIVDPLRYLVRSPYGSYVAIYPDTRDFTAEYFLYRHGNVYLEKTLDDKLGLLNERGKRVIQPRYDHISKLQEDSIYIAHSSYGYSFITKSGVEMLRDDKRIQKARNVHEGLIGVMIDTKWGFVDINGKLRISNQYENIGPVNEGLAPIRIRGRWGYINVQEDIIVQPTYDTVYRFVGGLCEVVKKGQFGLIDARGKIVLECEHDNISRLAHGGFLLQKNTKIGMANNEGRLMILPRFDQVADLNNGFVIASSNGKFGLLSSGGMSIIPMIYEELVYDPINDIYLAASASKWEEITMP